MQPHSLFLEVNTHPFILIFFELGTNGVKFLKKELQLPKNAPDFVCLTSNGGCHCRPLPPSGPFGQYLLFRLFILNTSALMERTITKKSHNIHLTTRRIGRRKSREWDKTSWGFFLCSSFMAVHCKLGERER